MTGNDMLSTLGLRLEDPDSSKFTQSARLDALNIAQKTVVNLIHNAYLTELEAEKTNVSLSSSGTVALSSALTATAVSFSGGAGSGATARAVVIGGYIASIEVTAGGSGYTSAPSVSISGTGSSATATSSIASGAVTSVTVTNPGDGQYSTGVPVRNGVIAVRVNGGKFCNMIEPRQAKRLENSYLAGATDNPVAYLFNETVYVFPTTTTAIDMWYLKQPTDIAANDVECELNVALHEPVVDFGESQLWKMDAQLPRAQAAQGNAMALIEALNARYPLEAPRGVGTRAKT